MIVNLQQTAHDGEASLRINATADSVMLSLLTKLGLPPGGLASPSSAAFAELSSRVAVPYVREQIAFYL